jgi:exodeoxyribonuclease V alpha subunit
VIFRENDRVMQTKNNYNMIWEKESYGSLKKELGNGVFNGELGIIENVNETDKTVTVKFDDGKKAVYENTDLEQLEHAYAITVHKAQGSEFDVVLVPIANLAPMLQTRNLIYTAITRAKKLIIIIGNRNTIDFMIKNNNTKNRNTGLQYKLKGVV